MIEWYNTNIVGSSIPTTNRSYTLLQKTLRAELIAKKFKSSKILVNAKTSINSNTESTETL